MDFGRFETPRVIFINYAGKCSSINNTEGSFLKKKKHAYAARISFNPF